MVGIVRKTDHINDPPMLCAFPHPCALVKTFSADCGQVHVHFRMAQSQYVCSLTGKVRVLFCESIQRVAHLRAAL